MAAKRKTASKGKRRAAAKNLVAKKLRTGEIAVWDPGSKSVSLLGKPGKDNVVTARIISGASFHALQEALGDVVVLA